ncbi:MAG: hypothetical protein HY814_07665 [Candidatus Riflebacteria bacterium]|nr:hypothetical protein [Candidatus Riflebacteria bacterium]
MPRTNSCPALLTAVALLFLMAVSGCANLDTPVGPAVRPQSIPRLVAMQPKVVTRGVAATVIASGTGFLPGICAFVGKTAQQDSEFVRTQVDRVDFVSTTRATLYLGVDLPAGELDVTLLNPDYGTARLVAGLTVVPAPDGPIWEGPQQPGKETR